MLSSTISKSYKRVLTKADLQQMKDWSCKMFATAWTESIHSFERKIENSLFFPFQLSNSVQKRSESSKEAQAVLHEYNVLSSKVRHLKVQLLSRGLSKTVFLWSIKTGLRKTADSCFCQFVETQLCNLFSCCSTTQFNDRIGVAVHCFLVVEFIWIFHFLIFGYEPNCLILFWCTSNIFEEIKFCLLCFALSSSNAN